MRAGVLIAARSAHSKRQLFEIAILGSTVRSMQAMVDLKTLKVSAFVASCVGPFKILGRTSALSNAQSEPDREDECCLDDPVFRKKALVMRDDS
jgi:hypothetical protein